MKEEGRPTTRSSPTCHLVKISINEGNLREVEIKRMNHFRNQRRKSFRRMKWSTASNTTKRTCEGTHVDLLDPDKMGVIGDLAMSCFPDVLGRDAGLDQRRPGEEGL